MSTDERYREDRNLVYISKWLRNAIKQYDSFQNTMDRLQKFFQNAEVLLFTSDFSKFGWACLKYMHHFQEKAKSKDRDMFPKVKLESDLLSSLNDKRKLPWPELSSSTHSAPKTNQKVKTECLSQKVQNIDEVAVDQKKVGMCYASPEVSKIVKKEISPMSNSPPMSYLLSACKVRSDFKGVADAGANHEVKREAIDLEEDDFNPR